MPITLNEEARRSGVTVRQSVRSESVYRAARALFPATGRMGSSDAGGARVAADACDKISSPVLARGKGATVIDVDGNEYVDYTAADGTLVLGHADERTVLSVNKAAAKGCGLGTPCEAEVRLAELVVGRLPFVDRIRFFHSRSEALFFAVHLATSHTTDGHDTKRDRKPDPGVDHKARPPVVLFDAGDDEDAPLPASGASDSNQSGWVTVKLRPCDLDGLDRRFAEHGDRVAAVVLDPAGGASGAGVPVASYADAARTYCDEHKALLILDETITGFRVGPGGAAGLLGMSPDLTVLGGALGGGLPLAACAGPDRIMAPSGAFPGASGAFAGSVSLPSLTSGIALLEATSEPAFYTLLARQSARLHAGLHEAADAAGVQVRHAHLPGMVAMEFVQHNPGSEQRVDSSESTPFGRYYRAMLERGIFVPPSPRSWMFVSAAHTDQNIDRTLEAARDGLRRARE